MMKVQVVATYQAHRDELTVASKKVATDTQFKIKMKFQLEIYSVDAF